MKRDEALEPEAETKRAQVPVRTTPSAKARLVAAAKTNGRSLTQEIEQRLERSLVEDDAQGGGRNARLFHRLAAEIRRVEAATGVSIWEDPRGYAAAYELMRRQISRESPPMKNSDAIRAATGPAAEAANAVRDRLSYLTAVGAVQPVEGMEAKLELAAAPIPHRGGFFGASSPLAPLVEEPEECRELRRLVAWLQHKILVPISAPGSEWEVRHPDGSPMTDNDKLVVRSAMFGLLQLAAYKEEKDAAVNAALAEDMAIIASGKRLAREILDAEQFTGGSEDVASL